jgi:hypothetical protein
MNTLKPVAEIPHLSNVSRTGVGRTFSESESAAGMGVENNKQRIGNNIKVEDTEVTILKENRCVLRNLGLPNEAEPIMICFDVLMFCPAIV